MTKSRRKRGAQAGAERTDRPQRDRPWLIRTYSGHTSAKASNTLYRTNLERGQTGLSVAFDLPTQLAYDSDHPLARGEVGKVGVPVSHLGDMETLFDGIPLDRMNTSMTINAPAAWLLALYVAVAERQGAARAALAGTIQNDIIKEYLSRGTHIFPPAASLRLSEDVIAFSCREIPKWNPINVCSYHLQEAGATPAQEIAFALANAIAVLDRLRDGGQVEPDAISRAVGRISFFVNAGIRFVTEMCKMRVFAELWDELCRNRYGVEDEKLRRFRYGVQVNSLGLTEQQPENNVYRILLEMLAVVLSKNARARAVQLPAWNEALGLPRPWDQQWSLRLQQIVAYETDLLEFGDLFDGSPVVDAKVQELKEEARTEMAVIEAMGGAIAAVESGYMKERLVESHARRVADIESGARTVVGVNRFTDGTDSPLTAGGTSVLTVDHTAEDEQVRGLIEWRRSRDDRSVRAALGGLEQAARDGANIMEASIACAHAGVTTGEWGDALRSVFGEYRAPTGIGAEAGMANGEALSALRRRVEALSGHLGRTVTMVMGKPGLDGHSNGAEQLALRAREAGVDVIYDGIRLTPREIAQAAQRGNAHIVGLSILSGSHLDLVREVIRLLAEAGMHRVPVVVGGIIPAADAAALGNMGVARVFTPKDYDLDRILEEIVGLIERGAGRPA